MTKTNTFFCRLGPTLSPLTLFFPILAFVLFFAACTKKSERGGKESVPRGEMASADIERYYEAPPLSEDEAPPHSEDEQSPLPEAEASNESSGEEEEIVWRKANLTHYESYPDPGSEECLKYNGCQWAGMFAALSGKQPESWVKANNIIAVHSKDFKKYKLKTFRLKKGNASIDAKVYDMCADSDCNGCCTKNSKSTGFLIDIEKYSRERFGQHGSGVVEWRCLDC